MSYFMQILGVFFLFVNLAAAENPLTKISFPGCPAGTMKFYFPNTVTPIWSGCKDEKGLYQGWLLQFTAQGELVRLSGIRNSLRNGKEIRFGAKGYLEERGYIDGHLNGDSLIFKSDSVLARILPKPFTAELWQKFGESSSPSFLRQWLKIEPETIIEFYDGRMKRIRFDQKDYTFEITPDGRMMARNHPEMKGLFFIDPMPMWNLSSDDLKRVIQTGFGSCKKYSGPVSRFGRHYDHLLYVRQTSEAKHIRELEEIRNRFLNFCIPEDIRTHLGVLECPQQLPGMKIPNKCILPISDRLKISYQPKYFNFDHTFKKSPEEFMSYLGRDKFLTFISDPEMLYTSVFVPPKTLIVVKKYDKQIRYRVMPDHSVSQSVLARDLEDKDWWDWRPLPGNE